MTTGICFQGGSGRHYEGQPLLCVSAVTRDYTEGKVYVVEKEKRALRLPSNNGSLNLNTISQFVPITSTEEDFAELVG